MAGKTFPSSGPDKESGRNGIVMASINLIILMGNLTRDPVIRNTHSGKSVVSLSLAINGRTKIDGEWEKSVDYFEVQAWGRLADNCNEYLKKGSSIHVTGRLKQDQWEDDNNQSRSKVYVVASNIEFLTRPQNYPVQSSRDQGDYRSPEATADKLQDML